MEHNSPVLLLPIGIVGKIDVGRLLREVQALNEFMDQAAIRQPGTPMQLPKSSRLMDEIIQLNKLNMLQTNDRRRLLEFLKAVQDQAPVLHMSFSADPSPHFLNRLMKYLREEIHPLVLLQVGLQPNIGAGCILRTTNKYFDFSLRQHLKQKQDVLMRTLRGAVQANQEAAK